jgi:phage internal scaffolding protein
VKTPFLRTAYNYNTNAASDESGLMCEDMTLTQQHPKDECDINNILRQFNITGQLPQNPLTPRYGDFSNVVDYHTALNAVIAAENEFDGLPAQIRARFENDPAQLIEFLENPDNLNEAIELGLVNKNAEVSNLTQPVDLPTEKAVTE